MTKNLLTLQSHPLEQIRRANVNEMSGKSEEALQHYRSNKELNARKDASPFVLKRVQDSVKRFSP